MSILNQSQNYVASNELKSSGYLGGNPLAGMGLFLLGSSVFILLTINLIKHGPLINLDLQIATYFHMIALKTPAWIIKIMIAGYYIGKQGITIVAVSFALYFFYKKFWKELMMIVVSFGFSGVLFLYFSHLFKRQRPFTLFSERIWANSPNIPGFPSGHTLSIAVLVCFLFYLIFPNVKSYYAKFSVLITALLIAGYIGFSRLFIGDHYLTDLVAGYALGIAWFSFSTTVVEFIFQRFKKE